MSDKGSVWQRVHPESPRREASSDPGSDSGSGSGRDSLSEFAFEMELPDMQDEGWIPDEERSASASACERQEPSSDRRSSAATDPRRQQDSVSNEVDWWQDLQQEYAAREQQHSARTRAASQKACDVDLLGSTPAH